MWRPSAGGPLRLYFYGAGFPGGVVVEAAPAIVFGMGDEAAFDRIAMDVLEFFYELLWTRYIEVVVAALPELFWSGDFSSREVRCLRI